MKMIGRNIELIQENCLDDIVGGLGGAVIPRPGLAISFPGILVNVSKNLASALSTLKLSITTMVAPDGSYTQQTVLTLKFGRRGTGTAD